MNLSGPRVALAVAVIVPLTRLPFRAETLYHWDSVNFALALDQFNISAHQPHPPGYPLFIVLAKLLRLVFADANLALIATAQVFEIAAATFFFLIASEFVSRRAAAVATLLLLFQPIFWFHGCVALSHASETAFSAGLAWAVAGAVRGDRVRFWVAPFVLAAGTGVRPNLGIILFPIYLYGLWRSPFGGKEKAGSFVTLGAAVAAWSLPLFALSGGFRTYLALVAGQSRADLPLGSPLFGGGLSKLFVNITNETLWLLSHAGLLWIAVGVILLWRRGESRRGTLPFGATPFLSAWLGPILLFQIFVQLTRVGQTLVSLPATFLAVAWAVERSGIVSIPFEMRKAALAIGIVLAGDIGLFLSTTPWRVETSVSARDPGGTVLTGTLANVWNHLSNAEFGNRELRRRDSAIASRLAAIRRYPPAQVAVAPEFSPRGEPGNWSRHLRYYLPGYEFLDVRRDADGRRFDLGTRDLLLVVDDLDAWPDRPVAAQRIADGVWRVPASALPVRYGVNDFAPSTVTTPR